MRIRLLSLILFLFPVFANSQNTIALPGIVNYSKNDYHAGTQNWNVVQGAQGIMYVANNEGLLTFDGNKWNKYILPNETIIRALAIGEKGKIYIGAQSEIGYFEPNNNGLLVYHSLSHLIPPAQKEFADVWNVIVLKDQVFFRSNKKIFQYNSGKLVVFPSINWDYLGYSNGLLLANEYEKGLLVYKNGLWVPFVEDGVFPRQSRVVSFLPLNKDTSLLVTKKSGIFYLSNNSITPFTSPDLQQIADKNVCGLVKINDQSLAIGTNLAGCFIVNRQGRLIQRLSKQEGLQNNNVISLFADKRQNLWLGLDNGIDFIAYNNAIKHIYPDKQEHSSGYACIIHDNSLYLGMGTGLYRASITPSHDLAFVRSEFTPVKNTGGQVWNLSEVNGKLLMGHNDGAYLINGDNATQIDGTSGFWLFMPLNPIQPSPIMLAGTYNGINFYHYNNGGFEYKGVQSHFESSRYVALDNNVAWVAHPYLGLYKVSTGNGIHPSYTVYNDKQHILSKNRNFVFKIKSRIILSTDNGLFEFDPKKDDFIPSVFLRDIFKNGTVQYLREDDQGNIWFIQDKQLGVVDFGYEKPQIVYIPELNLKLLTNGFDFVYPYNAKNVFVAGDQGFFLVNYDQYKTITDKTPLLITSVRTTGDRDSSIFAGYQNQLVTGDGDVNTEVPRLPYEWNTLHFDFSSPLYGNQASTEYAYMLEDFDKGWSAWSKKTEKEYTYLPPGSYTFKVKARSHPGDSPVSRSYRFSILPPWYRTTWAWLLYASLFALVIAGIVRMQKRKFEKQRRLHEEENKRLQYLHQLEIEKSESEIIKLRNEKLETELQLKNKELATTTINLVQKGEVLHKIKDEFIKLKKTGNEQENPEDLKKIIRMLEPEKVKKDWEQFALHFNQVHDEFLVAIKKTYPALTPNEIKLCAYLRLNISSKEIAHIMNITIKSVELSRYRLRKKLQLPSDANLFNFLLEFHSEQKKDAASNANGQVKEIF